MHRHEESFDVLTRWRIATVAVLSLRGAAAPFHCFFQPSPTNSSPSSSGVMRDCRCLILPTKSNLAPVIPAGCKPFHASSKAGLPSSLGVRMPSLSQQPAQRRVASLLLSMRVVALTADLEPVWTLPLLAAQSKSDAARTRRSERLSCRSLLRPASGRG